MSSYQVAKLAVGYVPRNTASDQDTCRHCVHSERSGQTLNCTKHDFWVWSAATCRDFAHLDGRTPIGPSDIS